MKALAKFSAIVRRELQPPISASERWKRRPCLLVEGLEERWTPTVANYWTNGAGDSSWMTAGNWTLNHAPKEDEIATFRFDVNYPDSTDACQIKGKVYPTVYGLDIQDSWGSNLTIDSTLTVTNTVNQAGSANVIDGTLQFNGQGGGTFTWSGGTRTTHEPANVQTAVTVINGGQMAITGGVTLDSASLVLFANGTWSAGTIALKNGGTVGISAGTFTVAGNAGNYVVTNPNSDPDVAFGVGSGATFTVATTPSQPGTNNDVTILSQFSNWGSVSVNSNKLELQGGANFKQDRNWATIN